MIFLSFTLVFCCLGRLSVGWPHSSSSILERNIQVLTLRQGVFTNARRSSAVPQLRCVGGTARCAFSYVPKIVQCVNKGSDGMTTQWQCQADLDNAVQFGEIKVSCEGFQYRDDPYVLVGSCALDYTLDFVTKEAWRF